MARTIQRLSPAKVRTAKAGMWCDGGGLYLQCVQGADGGLRRSWLYRFAVRGRERQMGLGSAEAVSLSEAREKAAHCRKLRQAGIDPIEHRKEAQARAALEAAKSMTFDECRDAYIKAYAAGWRNAKHRQQWESTLKTYCSPIFGKVMVQAVDIALVMKALEPIWATKPETASRLRGRIEAILNWAKVRGLREGENPARWRGHLDHLLPSRSKVRKVKHHAALPYLQISAYLEKLRAQKGVAARALEFLILTAARTGEVIGARWDEIDLQAKIWTIPASRMKAGREHRVPLTEPALAVLSHMRSLRQNEYVFPGDRRPTLSNMSLLMTLRRMNHGAATAHGFRSTFRTWAAERTNFPREAVEAALAHTVGNKVEAAYQRGDLFDKRIRLMAAWADFCATGRTTAGIVPLRSASSII
jgi:integrase